MSGSKEIHVWMADAFNFKGGIQVFNQFFLKALDAELSECHSHVFLKSDINQSGFLSSSRLKLFFFGRVPEWGRTVIWVFGLIFFAALKRP